MAEYLILPSSSLAKSNMLNLPSVPGFVHRASYPNDHILAELTSPGSQFCGQKCSSFRFFDHVRRLEPPSPWMKMTSAAGMRVDDGRARRVSPDGSSCRWDVSVSLEDGRREGRNDWKIEDLIERWESSLYPSDVVGGFPASCWLVCEETLDVRSFSSAALSPFFLSFRHVDRENYPKPSIRTLSKLQSSEGTI